MTTATVSRCGSATRPIHPSTRSATGATAFCEGRRRAGRASNNQEADAAMKALVSGCGRLLLDEVIDCWGAPLNHVLRADTAATDVPSIFEARAPQDVAQRFSYDGLVPSQRRGYACATEHERGPTADVILQRRNEELERKPGTSFPGPRARRDVTAKCLPSRGPSRFATGVPRVTGLRGWTPLEQHLHSATAGTDSIAHTKAFQERHHLGSLADGVLIRLEVNRHTRAAPRVGELSADVACELLGPEHVERIAERRVRPQVASTSHKHKPGGPQP
jgi:hypothetical protein